MPCQGCRIGWLQGPPAQWFNSVKCETRFFWGKTCPVRPRSSGKINHPVCCDGGAQFWRQVTAGSQKDPGNGAYLRVASSVSCPQNLLWPSLFSLLCILPFSWPPFLEPQLPVCSFLRLSFWGKPLGSDSIPKDFYILLNILTEIDGWRGQQSNFNILLYLYLNLKTESYTVKSPSMFFCKED